MENRMRLSTRLLLCLTNLLFLLIGSTLANECASCSLYSFCDQCINTSRVLSGQEQVGVNCDRDVGNGPWYHVNSSGSFLVTRASGSKYTGTANQLIIHNIVGADEGQYLCEVNGVNQTAGCVFVLGMGRFVTCNSRPCPVQEIAVQAGGTIVFDTRVEFTEAGPCGLPQDTGFFQLFKGNIAGDNIVYNCQSSDDPCPEQYPNQVLNKPVFATPGGGHRFNRSLTIRNAAVDDGGDYTFRVELRADGSNEPSITFRVTVTPTPTPIPTVVPSTETAVSSASPITTVNPSPPSTDGVATSPLPAVNVVAIAVPIVSVVVIALVCVLVLLLIFVIHRQGNSQSMSLIVKTIPVRPNRYVSADSTVTLEVDGMDKRESIVEEVELTVQDNQECNI